MELLALLRQPAFIFGILGNIVSAMLFVAPVPTFIKIYKKKTSEGFQSLPYIIGLLSAMLLLYYGLLKTNAILLVSINSIGCVLEVIYIILYLIYATLKDKVFTVKLVLLLNVGSFGLVMLITLVVLDASKRVNAVGWICAAFSICVFAAPLSIMKRVIKTKSVEYMPFFLSFVLVLSATVWFFYGFFVKDMYIALPNVLGFLLGLAQMILYMIYKDAKKDVDEADLKPQGTKDIENPNWYPAVSPQKDMEMIVSDKTNESKENNI